MAGSQSFWEEGRRAGGDWCFARRVAEQRERASAREPGAGSAPGPAFYSGQFRGKDRYRNRGQCEGGLEGGGRQELFTGPSSINMGELGRVKEGPSFALSIVWRRRLAALLAHILARVWKISLVPVRYYVWDTGRSGFWVSVLSFRNKRGRIENMLLGKKEKLPK